MHPVSGIVSHLLCITWGTGARLDLQAGQPQWRPVSRSRSSPPAPSHCSADQETWQCRGSAAYLGATHGTLPVVPLAALRLVVRVRVGAVRPACQPRTLQHSIYNYSSIYNYYLALPGGDPGRDAVEAGGAGEGGGGGAGQQRPRHQAGCSTAVYSSAVEQFSTRHPVYGHSSQPAAALELLVKLKERGVEGEPVTAYPHYLQNRQENISCY